MKQYFIIKNNQKHLLLFFAGWGMDETPFLQIHPTDKDWMICYDYRSLEFDADILQEYSEITLIAWSMGVWAASQIMKQYPSLPLSYCYCTMSVSHTALAYCHILCRSLFLLSHIYLA